VPILVTGFFVAQVLDKESVAQGTTCAPVPLGTNKKVAIMGDSIATPYGASTPSLSWPMLLKAQGATHGWDVSLHAIGSTTASRYLQGQDLFYVTEAVRTILPDLVLMDWRANEQLTGQTPAQLKTNLIGVIDTIKATSPNTKFVIVNPPTLFYHVFTQTPSTQADYIAKMYEAAQDRGACWVNLVPLYPTDGPNAGSQTWLFDDIHFSDAGHRLAYASIYNALLQSCS